MSADAVFAAAIKVVEAEEEKVNWHYYVCRGCNGNGNAHMITLQARMELCYECYSSIPKAWRKARGGSL